MAATGRLLRHTPLHPQWLVLRNDHIEPVLDNLLATGKNILDIGCGNRRLKNRLSSDIFYIGLEYPPTGIELYQAKAEVLGTAEALPLQHDSFDVVICLEVMEHLPHPQKAAAEISRVLQPGGQALVSVPFAYPLHDLPFDYQRMTSFQLTRMFESTGLSIKRLEETGHALESAALLSNLALSKTVLDALRSRSPGALLLTPLLLQIPILNMVGWLASRLAGACGKGFLPTGYYLLLEKPAWRAE